MILSAGVIVWLMGTDPEYHQVIDKNSSNPISWSSRKYELRSANPHFPAPVIKEKITEQK